MAYPHSTGVGEHGCRLSGVGARVSGEFIFPSTSRALSVWQLRVKGKTVPRRCREKNLDTPPKTENAIKKSCAEKNTRKKEVRRRLQ